MILAQFEGTCAACDHRIVPGQWIEDGGMDEMYAQRWRHAECPETPAEAADRLALAAGRCVRCGLNHPGEC